MFHLIYTLDLSSDHYHINGLYLFWDTQYNHIFTKENYILNKLFNKNIKF